MDIGTVDHRCHHGCSCAALPGTLDLPRKLCRHGAFIRVSPDRKLRHHSRRALYRAVFAVRSR